MKQLPARYAAWCRRQGTMQCSPAGMGLALLLVICLVASAEINHAVIVHKTGIMQFFAGLGAGLACLAAIALVVLAMRIVDAAPAPVTPARPAPEPARQPATVTAMTLTPEERSAMEAEADMLASDDMSLVVSDKGAVYGLQDEPEPEDAS